jgi:hypothetical protein
MNFIDPNNIQTFEDTFLIDMHFCELKSHRFIFKDIQNNPVKYLSYNRNIAQVEAIEEPNKLFLYKKPLSNLGLIARKLILDRNYNPKFYVRLLHFVKIIIITSKGTSKKVLKGRTFIIDRYNLKPTTDISIHFIDPL